MLTDWLLIRRLGAELDKRLRGARIRAAGLGPDGRFTLRTAAGSVVLDVFGDLPLIAVEGEIPLSLEPGWTRAFAAALEGLKIERIRARRGDRLIALDAASRSRFGVVSQYRIVAELVPRFGNLVLLKGEGVVAAAKTFERGGRTLRTIAPGEPYELPPLPGRSASPEALASAVAPLTGAGRHDDAGARKAAAKALRAAEPFLPALLAESFVAEAMAVPWTDAAALAARLSARARDAIASTEGEPDGLGDVFAYYDGSSLVQAHVVPLHQFDAATQRRLPDLMPLLTEAAAQRAGAITRAGFDARREALRARTAKRRAALAQEREARERDAAREPELERLRTEGDLLYQHAHEIPARATSFEPPEAPGVRIALDPDVDAKANAAAIFKRYRKAAGRRTHAVRRLTLLEAEERGIDELAWEIDRAAPETLEELRAAVDALDRRTPRAGASKQPRARRGPIEVALAPDARALVGRSPAGNADLTFRTARPDDLWFHARNLPGAHVVLRLDSTREPNEDEVRAAAALAAFHSKARAADKVEVDYTRRKFVRKQIGAAPGLVWYTNARTVIVAPRDHAAS
jgi:predicted ribosome quality control (RQC) complex YloA/Tae2 family protein